MLKQTLSNRTQASFNNTLKRPLTLFLVVMGLVCTSAIADPLQGLPFRPKVKKTIVQPPPQAHTTDSLTVKNRWHKIYQTNKETVYLDHTSVRPCDKVMGVSSLRSCRDVTKGFAYWKRVVKPASSEPAKILTGVVDCSRNEVNFYRIRPKTANEAIFKSLCLK